VRLYREAGCIAQRSPKSSSTLDVIAILPGGCVQLIQAKLGGYMPPAERMALVELAARYGAEPILAYGKNPVYRRNLRTGEELASL
jgi:Holliday junction resolvase